MFCQNSGFGIPFLVAKLGFKFLYGLLLNMGKCSHENLCYGVDLKLWLTEWWYMDNAGVTLKYFTQGSESFFKILECLNLTVSETNFTSRLQNKRWLLVLAQNKNHKYLFTFLFFVNWNV